MTLRIKKEPPGLKPSFHETGVPGEILGAPNYPCAAAHLGRILGGIAGGCVAQAEPEQVQTPPSGGWGDPEPAPEEKPPPKKKPPTGGWGDPEPAPEEKPPEEKKPDEGQPPPQPPPDPKEEPPKPPPAPPRQPDQPPAPPAPTPQPPPPPVVPPKPAPAPPPPPRLLPATDHPAIKRAMAPEGSFVTGVSGTYIDPKYDGRITGYMIAPNMDEVIKLFTGENDRLFGQLPKVLYAKYNRETEVLDYVFDTGGLVPANFGYSLKSKVERRPDGTVVVSWTRASTQLATDPRNQDGLITFKVNNGSWTLKPVPGYAQLYELTWQVHTERDPASVSALPWYKTAAFTVGNALAPDPAISKQAREDTSAIVASAIKMALGMPPKK